ncbi:MAG: hypothetical protein Q8P35_00390 [Candidatus Yanofskybacteria bacterium]|nr:hypothetical protein [Candidatus Yanofskybacteria bacterium]
MAIQNKQLTLTVGIPTCYGGNSLVATVKSLRASREVPDFRLVIVADRTPISDSIKKELSELDVELHWNKVEGSQIKKVKQVIATLNTEIFVHTQDDIIFHPNALSEILKAFERDSGVTMVGSRVLPLPPHGSFEAGMASMVRLVDRIGWRWNRGDNRLMASGRCLSYRVSHLRKIDIPEQVINADMFMYLANRKLGGRFYGSPDSVIYIRAPQNFRDQIGPSSRFQFQKDEIAEYLDMEDLRDYTIPTSALVSAVIAEGLVHPLALFWYVGIFIMTRLKRQKGKIVRDPVWEVDQSTKKVKW